MAQQKANDREVRKIKTSLAQDGQKRAEARFDKNSPEFQKAQQDQQRRRALARKHRERVRQVADGKEPGPVNSSAGTAKKRQQDQQKQAAPAQQQSQRTAAQQRIAERQKRQGQQNARANQRNRQRAQGMGM